MSLKKKLFSVPATVFGIFLGVLLGALTAGKEVLEQRFPKIGIMVTLATPVLAFLFEKIMSDSFGEVYKHKIKGNLLKLFRYILNEDFYVKFVYTIRFTVTPDSPEGISPDLICQALNARAGGDPEPASLGKNFIHLRFLGSPFLIKLDWYLDQPDDGSTESAVRIFSITLEPAVLNLAMRRAKDHLDRVVARLGGVQQALVLHFRSKPETQAVASAWFGDDKPPPPTPLTEARVDDVTKAEYRVFPGLLSVSGSDFSALGTVYRYVGTLEPPPERP